MSRDCNATTPRCTISSPRAPRPIEDAILHAKGSKAGTLLALNGALLAFLAFSLFSDADTVATITARFGVETWGLLSLMCVTLTASIVSTIAGLWSQSEPADFDVGFACGAITLILFLGAAISYVLRLSAA